MFDDTQPRRSTIGSLGKMRCYGCGGVHIETTASQDEWTRCTTGIQEYHFIVLRHRCDECNIVWATRIDSLWDDDEDGWYTRSSVEDPSWLTS